MTRKRGAHPPEPIAAGIARLLARTATGPFADVPIPAGALHMALGDDTLPESLGVPGGVTCSRRLPRALKERSAPGDDQKPQAWKPPP